MFASLCEEIAHLAQLAQTGQVVDLDELEAIASYFVYGQPKSNALHAVLGDGNLTDAHIELSVNSARSRGDEESVCFGELLLALSVDERMRIYKLLYE